MIAATPRARRAGPGLLGWPLAVVRLALLMAALALAVTAYYVFALFTPHNPAPSVFLRLVAAIAGIRLRTTGARPRRHDTCILLSNHVSWLDIPALAGASGCAFVAHDGLASIGPLRWLCELNDTVFVARHDRRSVARQVEQVRTALAEAGSLALFPEGTTSDGTGLLPFKSSLLSALDGGKERDTPTELETIPIQPIWLDYGRQASDIAWIGEEPGLANALRILARWRPIPLTVHFLAPLTSDELANRKTIVQAARARILDAMMLAQHP